MSIKGMSNKQPMQPRDKRCKSSVELAHTKGMPQLLLEEIEKEPWDPTKVGKGNAENLGDYEHALPRAVIDKLAEKDFLGWSALDLILLSIIRARPTDDTSEENRLKEAKIALLGISKKGPSFQNDHEILSTMANLYVRRKNDPDISEAALRAGALLSAVIDAEYWKGLGAGQQQTLRKRIRQKFNSDKEVLLAEVTAFFHPLQQRRFAATQEVMELLRELKIISELHIGKEDHAT